MRALALAFQLERFYTAVESLLTRILRTLDGDVPEGADSHRELLRAAGVPVTGLRPALFPAEILDALRELLSFRHYARHGYDSVPKLVRVEELAATAATVHTALERTLAAFEDSLRDEPA